jgi:hypothetical protein
MCQRQVNTTNKITVAGVAACVAMTTTQHVA